jgi:Zn-dependent peptidase ImmA (M78 family)
MGIFNLIDLVYYDGPKISYDLIKRVLIVWHDETESCEEFLFVECRDDLDSLLLYLTNNMKLRDLMLKMPLRMCHKQFNGDFEILHYITNKDTITLPTENSYLTFSFLDNYTEAKAGNYTFKSIEHFANSIFEEFKDDIQNIKDFELRNFVKKYGGNVHYINFDLWKKTEQGSIIVNSANNFDIFLPAYVGIEANRLTVAHELGHYFLHSQNGQQELKAARNGNGLCEDEATFFAMSLLVPRTIYDSDLTDTEIANKYYISSINVKKHREFLDDIKK